MIRVGIIGSGAITLANHLPGFEYCPETHVVALCDSDAAVLDKASRNTGITTVYQDYRQLIARDDIDAVVIATPNFTHGQIALEAIAAGKHVLCEKPLAMDYATALNMYQKAEAAGIRHMTAFTYRFVPALRYMCHLLASGATGPIYHFRAQRFQDWGERGLGWRQVRKLAGTGEMGDMLSHRIDLGHLLVGQIRQLVAEVRTHHPMRGGRVSDVDDWVAMLADFETGATGVLESTKLATGRGEGYRGRDVVEVNGPEGTIVYSTQRPLTLRIGKRGGTDLETIDVPKEFLVAEGSSRDPSTGDPLVTFRYDQNFEFIDAIRNGRSCRPSFREGARTQAVMDAALKSAEKRQWVQVEGWDDK